MLFSVSSSYFYFFTKNKINFFFKITSQHNVEMFFRRRHNQQNRNTKKNIKPNHQSIKHEKMKLKK